MRLKPAPLWLLILGVVLIVVSMPMDGIPGVVLALVGIACNAVFLFRQVRGGGS